MNPLPTELRFPKPPFRIEQSALDHPPPDGVLSGYLDKIRQWRLAVLTFLEESDAKCVAPLADLTERAREALAACLASAWSQNMTAWATQSPYNFGAFPAPALDAATQSSMDLVLNVLRWRAGLIDMLSDIWDVLDEPELDLDECMAIGQFLHPADQQSRCAFCLTEFAQDQLHPSQHQCRLLGHVRAKWPEFPPSFKRWAGEAQRAEDPVPPAAWARRKWWQFWK